MLSRYQLFFASLFQSMIYARVDLPTVSKLSIAQVRKASGCGGFAAIWRVGSSRISLTGLQLAADIANAQLTGAKYGSTNIAFTPTGIKLPVQLTADSVTAGSTMLLFQIALPFLLFAPAPVPASTLLLLGGTNATMAPQFDYAKHVFLPLMQNHFGLEDMTLDIKKRGYYPRGGGEIHVSVRPFFGNQTLKSIRLMERGSVTKIGGIAHSAGLSARVSKGMVAGAKSTLEGAGFVNTPHSRAEIGSLKVPIMINYGREPDELTTGAGSGIVLWAELEGGGIIGGSAVGKKGLQPEIVGKEAANELIRGIKAGGCIDEWTQDQIIIFMALAKGKSEVRCGGLTLHTRTAIWLAQQMTKAEFEIEEETSGTTVIRCQGIGYCFDGSENPTFK